MYVTVSTAIPAAAGVPVGAPGLPIAPNAYAVPRIDTAAVANAVIRFVHHGVSGYIGFGVGGVNDAPEFVFIVYFKRLVLLSMNNNGWWWLKTC
jgi:hypothetical protein